jgi:hypothetical protein
VKKVDKESRKRIFRPVFCWALIFFVFLLSVCTDKKDRTVVFDEEKLVGEWVDMWNSYDLSLVDKLFLTDCRLTYFSSEREGVIKGIEAVREHHEGFGFVPGGKEQENKLWVEDIQSEVFGTTAVVTGIWYFSSGDGETEKPQRGPLTFVYVNEGTEFRLAHLNFAEYKEEKN